MLHGLVSELTESIFLLVTTQGVHGHGTYLNRVDDDALEIALLYARGPWCMRLMRRLFLGGVSRAREPKGLRND